MTAMYVSAFEHYSFMFDAIQLCNKTLRSDLGSLTSGILHTYRSAHMPTM